MRVHLRRSMFLLSAFMAVSILFVIAGGPSVRAGEAPANTKEKDVVTQSAGPYTGPTQAEVAKAAAQQAGAPTAPPAAKLLAISTITKGDGGPLTPAQQAKLATLQQQTPPSAPVMTKLPPMVVPKDGIPEMTAQELQKLADQRAHEGSQSAPAGENGQQISGSGQSSTGSATPAANASPKENAVPTTPGKATRTDR